jgi:ATP-dependent DNA helicase RecQ
VLPTGGGKSLCYQVPPLVTNRLTLVVSPLIALMQDQVSGLKLAGVPAAAAHSLATAKEQAAMLDMAREGRLRLLFVAPERLFSPSFMAWLVKLDPGHIAIDEAHCISQWGHDFRPEYRRLAEVREALPRVAIGAYTATATPRVREDIARQLHLRDPAVLVGSFDRPNLTYRVRAREGALDQIAAILHEHAGEAAIVYCLSRRETEHLASGLSARKIRAEAYHAGLDAKVRRRLGEDFRSERVNVVCATVAFGMGIDRGDVRCVIHATMPKSIEHYQQEIGRAGRDGLPAECVLLYSAGDLVRWKTLMARSADEGGGAIDPAVLAAQHAMLREMQRLATAKSCRRRAILAYFGETYAAAECGACDVCLGESVALAGAENEVADGHEIARKILSCVFRVGQRFGGGHVADVLMGKTSTRVRELGHDQLSTFALLPELSRPVIAGYIEQLVEAGHLERTQDEFPVLRLTASSAAVLKSLVRAVLMAPAAVPAASAIEARPIGASGGTHSGRREKGRSQRTLSADERALFEALRIWRRSAAEALGACPPSSSSATRCSTKSPACGPARSKRSSASAGSGSASSRTSARGSCASSARLPVSARWRSTPNRARGHGPSRDRPRTNPATQSSRRARAMDPAPAARSRAARPPPSLKEPRTAPPTESDAWAGRPEHAPGSSRRRGTRGERWRGGRSRRRP